MRFLNPLPSIWFDATTRLAVPWSGWRNEEKNAILTQIICINKLIWDRCCCSTDPMSCVFAFALCFSFFRSIGLYFGKHKPNKALGFSVWLIFFISFLSDTLKCWSFALLAQCSFRDHTNWNDAFSCVLMLKLCSFEVLSRCDECV